MTGSDTQGQDQSTPSHPIKTDSNLPLIRTENTTDSASPDSSIFSPLLLASCSHSFIFSLHPSVPPSRPACLTLRLRPWWTRARLAHKAGVLCIMLTIKDSISSLILFTSPTSAQATGRSINTAGRGEREGNTDADVHLLVKWWELESRWEGLRFKRSLKRPLIRCVVTSRSHLGPLLRSI